MSKSFQGMATGYTNAMGKMGTGLAKVAQVGTMAAGNLVENIKKAKTQYGESGAFSAVMGNFKGIIKEGFDVITSKKGEERDAKKQDFKNKWKTSVGSLKSMIDETFMVETIMEEGEFNQAYLEENPDKAAQFSIVRSGKDNPVDAPGLPYDGCYSEMESVDGEWVKKFYGPSGEPITSFDPDGTPKYGGEAGVTQRAKARAAKTKVEDLPEGVSITPDVNDKGSIRKLQGFLQEQGYDISFTNKQGKTVTGSAAVDGEFGVSTEKALLAYRADRKKREGQQVGEGQATLDELASYDAGAEQQFSVSGNDISNLIVRKDPEVQAGIQDLQLKAMEAGSQGLKFRSNEYRNGMKELVNDRDKFSDMTYTPVGNEEFSYAQLLAQPNEMTQDMFNQVVTVANNLAGIERGSDGVLNMEDFDGPEDAKNLEILRKEMLNYDNVEAREIFLDYLTNEGAARHKEQLDIYNKKLAAASAPTKTTKKKEENELLFNVQNEDGSTTYVRQNNMNENATAFKQIETGQYAQDSFEGWNGQTYSFENDQWFVGKGNDKMAIPRSEVVSELKFSGQPNVMQFVGGSLEDQDVGFVEGSNDIFFQSQTGEGSANMGNRDDYTLNPVSGHWEKDGKTVLFKDENGDWRGQKVKGMPELAASRKLAGFLQSTINDEYAS